jgi:predicted phosphodiesterase
MSDEDLKKDLEAAYRKGDTVPAAWKEYTEIHDQVGSAIVRLPNPKATEHDLLLGAGFDPDEWRITPGTIQFRKWQAYDGRWLNYFKFSVTAAESAAAVQAHVDDLVKHIRRRRVATRPTFTEGDAFAVVASDWQIGKAEGGSGTDQTVDRILEAVDMTKQRIKDLRRIGRQMPTGALLGLGDLVEGCIGFYPAQQFNVDRTRREQGRITRELITHIIDEIHPLFETFVIATVAGNHGENRHDGKSFTNPGDNDDVAAFEAVREAFTRAGTEGLRWFIPDEELSMSIPLGGVHVGMTHGHMFRKGSTVQAKAHEWWKNQEFGLQPVSGSDILLSGHFHHFSAVTYGRRTAIQAPAMDPGSQWFRFGSGEETPAGLLTLRLDKWLPLNYGDLEILSPKQTYRTEPAGFGR